MNPGALKNEKPTFDSEGGSGLHPPKQTELKDSSVAQPSIRHGPETLRPCITTGLPFSEKT